jgi:hypothetical protein
VKKLPDGLLVVAEAVVGIAKEVAGLRLALYVVEFLAQHQVGLVEGNSLSELTAARVTIACACAKRACYDMTLGSRAQEGISAHGQILFVFLAQQVGLVEENSLSELTAARVTIACACEKRVFYVKKTLVEF